MKTLIPFLILVLILAACSKEEGSFKVATRARSHEATAAAPERATSDAGAGATLQTVASTSPRMIVRTADVRMIVADTEKALRDITRSAEAAGGYVSGSNIWREGELLRAKLTLRVPTDRLTETLASIRSVAKRVEQETVSSEDVSQEFVDLESQVRNLEATEAELRELLTVARQNSRKAADVLEVHAQLTIIRGQIEQARGRMRYLSEVSAMSSISLDVVPDALAQPVVQPGWQPLVVVRDASRALVALLQNVVTIAIWFVIYLLPILGMLALIVFALVRIARRSRAREA